MLVIFLQLLCIYPSFTPASTKISFATFSPFLCSSQTLASECLFLVFLCQHFCQTLCCVLVNYICGCRYSHYTVSLAHHVVAMWFLKCRISYRKNLVAFILKVTAILTSGHLTPFLWGCVLCNVASFSEFKSEHRSPGRGDITCEVHAQPRFVGAKSNAESQRWSIKKVRPINV